MPLIWHEKRDVGIWNCDWNWIWIFSALNRHILVCRRFSKISSKLYHHEQWFGLIHCTIRFEYWASLIRTGVISLYLISPSHILILRGKIALILTLHFTMLYVHYSSHCIVCVCFLMFSIVEFIYEVRNRLAFSTQQLHIHIDSKTSTSKNRISNDEKVRWKASKLPCLIPFQMYFHVRCYQKCFTPNVCTAQIA